MPDQEAAIIRLKDDIWYAEDRFNLLGARLGTRMSIIRLEDGSLFIHSPIRLTALLIDQINTLGRVKYVVAPSAMHNLNVNDFLSAFPNATGYYAEGAKLKQFEGLTQLDTRQTFPWQSKIASYLLSGMPKVNEWVFYHKDSNSLIVCDLFFNLSEPLNSWTRLIAKLYGVHDQCTPTPLFKMMIKDSYAFEQSATPLLELPVEHIILSHGHLASGERVLEAMATLRSLCGEVRVD